jgi:hypothetical protein
MFALDNLLFSQQSLHSVLHAHLASVKDRIRKISKDQFLANSDEQVSAYVFSEMEILPLTIYRDRTVLSEPLETKNQRKSLLDEVINVDSVETILSIPYTGESDLWKFQPSSFDSNLPRGSVVPDRRNDQVGILKVKLIYTQREFSSDEVNREIDRIFGSIDKYIQSVKRDIDSHNQKLRAEISRQVRQRREQLGAMENTLQKLNIPIARRDGAPDINTLPIRRKVVEPLSSQKPSQPEYAISDEAYANILNVLRHEGISFERTPATFAVHDEEELRDILLAHLNSHFQGQATGETFRKKGKTDICIDFENRAAFVAECKLQKGRQALLDALDQLLGYLTWRDVKAALVLFNKNVAGFKQIQEKVLGILQEHQNHHISEFLSKESEWNLMLRSKEDSERLINVRVFLFNLHTS